MSQILITNSSSQTTTRSDMHLCIENTQSPKRAISDVVCHISRMSHFPYESCPIWMSHVYVSIYREHTISKTRDLERRVSHIKNKSRPLWVISHMNESCICIHLSRTHNLQNARSWKSCVAYQGVTHEIEDRAHNLENYVTYTKIEPSPICIMSYMNESVPYTNDIEKPVCNLENDVTCVKHEPCPIWVMSHMNESCPIHRRANTQSWKSCHVPGEWGFWVLSHVRHVTYESIMSLKKTTLTYLENQPFSTWVMSHMNESCHIWMIHVTYERVISHTQTTSKRERAIWISHVPFMIEKDDVHIRGEWAMHHVT